MDNLRQTLKNFAMVALLSVGIIVIYNGSFSSFPTQLFQSDESTDINEAYKDDLEKALAKASMGNKKTLIIAVVNSAYVEQDVNETVTMFDLFLTSFWLGEETSSLVDNLLIVAVDRTAYDRCMFFRLNCFKLETNGVDFGGEKYYMSQDFIVMMWRRTFFLLEVLKRGYSFIFTDTDVMWLRNPFKKLGMKRDEDLLISTDRYNGGSWLVKKQKINTGFYFVRSNKKTISLFETWYKMKDNSRGKKEQDVLEDLIKGGIFKHLKLKVRFLNTLYFSGFCEDSQDFRAVTTVHANCCRGITAKVADLKVTLSDWKQFKKLEVNSTRNIHWSSHERCLQSWES